MIKSKTKSRQLWGNRAKNAIDLAYLAFKNNRLTQRMVNDVLDCADKTPLEVFDQFLEDENELLRTYAAFIVANRGAGEKVVEQILIEDSVVAKTKMIRALQEADFQAVDGLVALLDVNGNSPNALVSEAVLQLVVKAGRKDLLMGAFFSQNPILVQRAKAYYER